MRTLFFTAAALVLAAPSASAQQTPEQLIVGAWRCSAPAGDLVAAGDLTYNADGTSTFDQEVTGPVEGMPLVVRIVGTATWYIDDDGNLSDSIVTAESPSGTIGGQPLPADTLETFAAEVKANGYSVSPFTVGAQKLMISDGQGGGSDCTRKGPA